MEHKIKKQQQRMLFVILLIFAMTAWQFNFIYDGVMANVYMNGAIIFAFLFACLLAFHQVYQLKREVVAMNALREMWDDIRHRARNEAADPYWRHYRALKPGIVFQPPKILGHAYDMVVDEIARTKTLRLGVETMTTLIHKIDQKLADERSFLGYMSGLLVFMGLIGAFIGLLKMVGSIGGIIGGLEGAAAGGGDGFGKLLGDLQKPLGGMATGFASSLFGLFGSLVVSLLGRFVNDAATAIKNEFEDWLVSVAQIDGPAVSSGGHASGFGTGANTQGAQVIAGQIAGALDPVLTKTMQVMAAKNAEALERTTETIRALAEKQADQADAVRQTADKLTAVVANQTEVQQHIARMTTMGNSISEMKVEMERMAATFEKRVATSFEPLTRLVETALRAQFETLERLAAQQTELTIAITRLSDITPTETQGMIGEKLEAGVNQGFDKVARVLDTTSRAIAHGLHQLAQQQMQVNTVLTKLNFGGSQDFNPALKSLERTITTGFIEVGRALEIGLSAPIDTARQAPKAPAVSVDEDIAAFDAEALAAEKAKADPIAMAEKLYQTARAARGEAA